MNFFLSYVLCLFQFFCMIFVFVSFFFGGGELLIERGVHFYFSQLHLKIQQTLCVKCTFFFFLFWMMIFFSSLQVFILKFVHTSLQEDILLYYIVIFSSSRGAWSAKMCECNILDTCLCERAVEERETNMWPRYYWTQICTEETLLRTEARKCFFLFFVSSNIQCVLEINSDVLSKTRSSILLFPIGGHL